MKKKVIIGIGAGIVLTAIIGISVWRQNMNGDGGGFGGKEQPVTTQTVNVQEITSTVSVTGVAKEALKQEMQAKEVLEITKVNNEKGDIVKKGDVLFEVDVKPLEDELEKLKLNQEREYLQLSRLSSESNVSGVESAKISNELSRLTYEAAQKEVATQEKEYKKHQELYGAGIISEAELDTAKANLDNAKTQLNNAQLNLEQSQVSVREIQSTTANTNQAKDFDIRAQRLALESIDLDIANLEERVEEYRTFGEAKIDGIVSEMDVHEGDFLEVQEPMATIISDEEIIIEANIREYDIREIRIGQEVLITGDAIDESVEVKGRVQYIAPVAAKAIINGRESTSILVEIVVEQGVEEVKPGYTVECEITTLKNEEAIVISYEMFAREKDGEKTVFVVNENNVLEERVVEVGITSDFDAEITSGIEKNELVVVNPSMLLHDGMKVSVNERTVEEGN
ncbi:HlyD family efflux transporter periplasmic adaptor subunit [Vallitaleaceae bacterium 9-2]